MAISSALLALALTAAGGERVSLDEVRGDREALVIVFWSASCPCVRRYQERVDALAGQYPQARVVAVASNAGESFEDALRVAKERGVQVPLYRDEDGSVADALGARS